MERLFRKRMVLVALQTVLLIMSQTTLTQRPALAQETDVPRDRFLVLDARVIESTENAKLVLGTVKKHKANPLFGEDKPWEKRFDNLYGNVIYDNEENIFKCWYSPFVVDHSAKGMTLEERQKPYRPPPGRQMGVCYATSQDGIHWEKPSLGLVEYAGSRENNIVRLGPHGTGVFKDMHERDPGRRYKSIQKGLSVSVSPDGLNWKKPRKCKGVQVRGDTHNNALWAPTLGRYVGITRTKGEDGREVARIESDDYETWNEAEVVLVGDRKQQAYAMPVFYHGGVYLGLIAIYADRPIDRVWTELAWSPDTVTWNRIAPGTPLIPCSEETLDYDYGCVYACATPVFLDDEIRLYYGGSDYLHFGWRTGSLCLATLRPDGFAGYTLETEDKPALVTTTAIPYRERPIRVSADIAQGGSIRVSVLDPSGSVIAEAQPVPQTVTDARLKFERPILSDKIRLRFELEAAKIYSFSFGD